MWVVREWLFDEFVVYMHCDEVLKEFPMFVRNVVKETKGLFLRQGSRWNGVIVDSEFCAIVE